jgi:hypothetical protein
MSIVAIFQCYSIAIQLVLRAMDLDSDVMYGVYLKKLPN